MRLNKICALLALLIFPLSTLHAQKFTIRGFAIDAYTTEMIDSVWVTLMGTDSTIIATHFKKSNRGHFDSIYLVKNGHVGDVHREVRPERIYRQVRDQNVPLQPAQDDDGIHERRPDDKAPQEQHPARRGDSEGHEADDGDAGGARSSTTPTRSSWPRGRCLTSSSPCCPAWS